MGSLSITHLLLLVVVVLIFFGPSRLPQLGESVGKAIRGFKKGISTDDDDSRDVTRQQLPQQDKDATAETKEKQKNNQG